MTIDPRKPALPSASRPRATCCSRSERIDASASSTRVASTSRDHERHLEPAQEERRELRRHQPRADDADLLDPARLASRDADASLRPALDEVEGVDDGLRLRRRAAGRRAHPPRRGSPPRASSPRRPRSGRARGRARVRRRARRRRRRSAPSRTTSAASERSAVARASRRSSTRATSQAIESSRNSTSSSSASARPSSTASRRVEQPVLPQRVGDDQLDRRCRADEARQELCAAPGRDDPEEDLREAEVAHRAGEMVRKSQCSAISRPPPSARR